SAGRRGRGKWRAWGRRGVGAAWGCLWERRKPRSSLAGYGKDNERLRLPVILSAFFPVIPSAAGDLLFTARKQIPRCARDDGKCFIKRHPRCAVPVRALRRSVRAPT